MKASLFAAVAALSTVASAVMAAPPGGSDVLTNRGGTADFLLSLPAYPAFTLNVDFDKSQLWGLTGTLDVNYTNFYSVPPNAWYPDGWEPEGGLDAPWIFDPTKTTVFRSVGAPTRVADIVPTATGIRLDFFGDLPFCVRKGDRDRCSEVDGARYLALSGVLPADVTIPITWSYSEAPSLSAVPEPAVWAMMIAGFGLTGASLRRRGRASA